MKFFHTFLGLICTFCLVVIEVRGVGPLCFSCKQVPHQRDCTRIVRCGEGEKCAGKSYITSDGRLFYESGCETKSACLNLNKNKKIAAGDTYICDKCCEGDYCNENVCDASNTNRNRCLFCDDVLNVTDCNLSVLCDDDQICYTQTIFVNKQPRYRLGCASKILCDNSTSPTISSSLLPPLIGRRDILPSGKNYCGRCCQGMNCNLDLCGSLPTGAELKSSPQFLLCQDYDTSECQVRAQFDQDFCRQNVNKDYLCPRTCGTCSGGGLPVGTTPVGGSTQVSTVGTTVACKDDLLKCVQPLFQDLFCNTAGPQCKKTCGLCGNGTTFTNTASPKSTSAAASTSSPTKSTIRSTVKPTTKSTVKPTTKSTVKPTTKSTVKPTTKPTTPSTLKPTRPSTAATVQSTSDPGVILGPPGMTAAPPVCKDPIPECQCKYLDREIDLCQNNGAFKQFCCFYCKRQLGVHTCPDDECKQEEYLEQTIVEKIYASHGNITCTDGN